MKKCFLFLLLVSFVTGIQETLLAQEDTTWVQAFTFEDVNKRRDVFDFPDASHTYRKILMVYTLKCDAATTADQFPCGEWDYLTYNYIYDHTGELDADGNEILERYEIGRFITPYGINLTLGSGNGFTWMYDVTDYAPLLTGSVDFSAGNNQELIDVKFMMIEGTPPRDVMKLDRIWGTERSYSYRALTDDTALAATTLALAADASQFKVITRLTGHGHNSNDGGFPHCCEWKNNTHYLYANGEEAGNWSIFQQTECALNPVFPQGGTWPGAREGWCPGDVVKDFTFDVTPYATNGEITLDYGITPVPSDNEGMGNGNYHIAMHLLHYGAQNKTNDVEIYEILRPNDRQYYSRLNPVCDNPEIVIRNNGTTALTNLDITYGVSGGATRTMNWTGNLAPNEKETLSLYIPSSNFWLGDEKHEFTATVSAPNGQTDEYAANDSYTSSFELPDVYVSGVRLRIRTNNRASENSYTIKNVWGDVVVENSNLENNSEYWETFDFGSGCYTLEFMDTGNDGLSYWADADAGSGSIAIFHQIANIFIHTFETEFGRSVRYSFTIDGLVSAEQLDAPKPQALLTPNPAKDKFSLELAGFSGDVEVQIINAIGEVVKKESLHSPVGIVHTYSTSNWTKGIYFVKLQQDNTIVTKKILIQ